MKKMCEHWHEGLDVTCCPIIKSKDGKDMVCAGYYKTKPGCEIVQPKKRTRTVRVWALKGNPRYCAPVKYENFCIPATLTYEVKEEGK